MDTCLICHFPMFLEVVAGCLGLLLALLLVLGGFALLRRVFGGTTIMTASGRGKNGQASLWRAFAPGGYYGTSSA